MLRITPKLRKHLQDNFALKADASDAEARELVTEKMLAGELEVKTINDLTAAEVSETEDRLSAAIAKAMAPLTEQFTKAIEAVGSKQNAGGETATETDATKAAEIEAAKTAGRRELVTKMAELYGISEADAEAKLPAVSTAAKGYGMAGAAGAGSQDGDTFARVKSVVERYRHNPTAVMWDRHAEGGLCQKSGKVLPKEMPYQVNTGTAEYGGYTHDLDMPTERSKAIAGAWFKWLAYKSLRNKNQQMTPLDLSLIQYAVHECKFVGPIGFTGDADSLLSDTAIAWTDGYRLNEIPGKSFDLMKKSILDDSTSGGLEAVPIEFDDAFILTPLLEGELFPLVNLRTVSRRRIEASRFGNLVIDSGVGEGTQISLFNTDSFISAFDTTIYPATGSVKVGLDFLADSPINVGNIIVSEYGKAFRKWGDDVIADGNGTNQPEGIFQASGSTAVSSAGGAGAAPEVGDYESLYFDIPKEYRNEAGARFIYLSTDVSYKRARGIPVDSSSDARRIFGMDQKTYTLFDNPYRVTQASGVTNAEIAGVMINRYRMYRRQGLEVRIVTEDAQLARTNEQLIVVRARFGGQMETGAAIAKITDGQV